MAHLRERAPELRARILGDGPERSKVLAASAREGLHNVADAPGFVSAEEAQTDLARATCMVLPSRREGYGLIVVDASSHGVPSVVVADPDNAAVELVADGVDGVVAASTEPEPLASAIARVRASGPALRASTADWFSRNAGRPSLDDSLARAMAAYERELTPACD